MSNTAAVIFDLDGTLVDSLPGIESSARSAIGRALPEELMPDLRALIGPPIAEMFAKAWPNLEPERFELLLAEFRAHYLATGCLLSVPFPGVPETLARLQATGLRLFVLTNKPAASAGKILGHLGLAAWFAASLSPDSVIPPFGSKSEGGLLLMEMFDLAPEKTTLVGDGVDDAASAATCGFRFIAAAYGYGPAAETAATRVEKFSDIERYLL
jgi:phosphoglycolate phosphatase